MAPGLGEFERIAQFYRPLARGFDGALGLTDDAGLLTVPPGRELVVTTDAMVADIHYLAGEDPARLAKKLLRVNLSDLAAMGAEPLAYTLITALPPEIDSDWVARLAAGLADDQQRYGIALLGGDSVSTRGPEVLSITALGTVEAGQALRRSGARPGDTIFVSGTVGDGVLGLEAARGVLGDIAPEQAAALAGRYHLPQPRVDLGRRLVGLATAAIDLSDGLAGDLPHVCRASGVGAVVETARLPLSGAAQAAIAAHPNLRRAALAGGDDYELLFTAPAGRRADIAALAAALGLPVTPIGAVTAGSAVAFLDEAGRPIDGLSGWTHF